MPVSIGNPGLMFRFVVAGMTAILIVLVMSTAVNLVVGAASGVGGDITGGLIQTSPTNAYLLIGAEIAVGVLTFIGSFFVMSKK